jgi:hypothetical protein
MNANTNPNANNEDALNLSLLFRHPHFNQLLPPIFSYLTLIELIYIQSVNRNWYQNVKIAQKYYTKNLHFGQFWSRISTLHLESMLKFVNQFEQIIEVNFSYCHLLTNDICKQILTNIPNYNNIEKLNLFYCYELTDDFIEWITVQLPHLHELNLGRCIKLTDRTLLSIAKLPQLRILNIVYNPNVTIDSLMMFDDPSCFRSLQSFNVINCKHFQPEVVEDLHVSRPHLRITGPLEVFPLNTGKT